MKRQYIVSLIMAASCFSTHAVASPRQCGKFYLGDRPSWVAQLVGQAKAKWSDRPLWMLRSSSARMELAQQREAHSIVDSIIKGRFGLTSSIFKKSEYDPGGVGISRTLETSFVVPNLETHMGSLGFELYSRFGERSRDNSPYYTYRKNVPFGEKFLEMIVSVKYNIKSNNSDPVFEYTGDMGGSVFMGYAHRSIKGEPTAIQVTFQNSGDWGILQTWDRNSPLRHPPYVNGRGDYYSYDTLTERKQLALDLTRDAIKVYHANGFERMGYNDFIPDVDMSVTRGTTLTNTDPITLKLDPRGHFLLFLNNLSDVMEMPDADFIRLRQETPQYRNINKRRGYNPVDGELYELVSSK